MYSPESRSSFPGSPPVGQHPYSKLFVFFADAVVKNISPSIELITADDNLSEDEVKNSIMRLITKEMSSLLDSGVKDKAVVTLLWKFDSKDKFARKRVKGRTFSYEFGRLPLEVQDKLDRMIALVLKDNLNSL
ncbi:plasmid Partition par B protein [Shigella sonnei]|nr:plasmid Partition par B protein [Shigella sonnei]